MKTEKTLNIGTHTSHCCLEHGCKYNEENCPVELKTHEQEFPCEECQPPEVIRERIASLREELKQMEALEARLGKWKNYNDFW